MPRKPPAAVTAYFRAIGKKYGASGGRTAAANMTAAERKARSAKGGQAAARSRAAKASKP